MHRIKYYLLLIILCTIKPVLCQEYDCEIITYSTRCSIENNKLVAEKDVLLQINNRRGDNYSRISIPSSAGNKVSNIYAHIEDMHGNIIRKLKNNEIVLRNAISESSLYTDDFLRTFELKHNSYPYRISLSYKTTYSDFLFIENWSPVLFRSVPTKQAILSLKVPENYRVKNFIQGAVHYETSSLPDGRISHEWSASYEQPVKTELFSPSLFEIVPNVRIVPETFKYGLEGSHKTWESFGNWQYRLNNNLDKLPEAEIAKISELVRDVSGNKEKVKILYHYLQDNTRYVNVSIDIGGLKSYPAEYVAYNKYGDCKALTNYMKTLLHYAGIRSYYATLYAGENPEKLIVDFPSHQSNHAILFVPMEKDTFWLECTNKTTPFGFVGTFIQNRPAFIIDECNSHFVMTPELSLEDNSIIRNFRIKPRFTATEIHLRYLCRGEYFDMFNEFISTYNKVDQNKLMHEYIPFSIIELKNWNLKQESRDSAEITLTADVSIQNFTGDYGNQLFYPVPDFDLPHFDTPQKRKLPLHITYPITKTDSVLFDFPVDSDLSTSFDDAEIINEFGTYRIQSSITERQVLVVKTIRIYRGEYSVDKYPAFYEFFNKVDLLEKKDFIILNKSN